MADNKQRLSYFAEMRKKYNNANYFNHCSPIDIKKNARRIIRDIYYGNIIPEDYVYFTNTRITDAILELAREEVLNNSTISNALNFYLCNGLNIGFAPSPDINLGEEQASALNLKMRYDCMIGSWSLVINAINGIQYYGPTYMNILQSLDKQFINSL